MNFEYSIGVRLKELRAVKKVSQDEVANMLQVKRQTYSAYERDVSIPDAITVKKLANFFDVTTDYLLGKSDSPTTQELIIPEELKNAKVAFHRGAFEDLTQYEVDRLAEFAQFIKSQRKDNK